MKLVYSGQQALHYPREFLVNGVMQVNPEVPERAERLHKAALVAGCSKISPDDYGFELIRRIHSERYLTFLEHAVSRWQRIKGAADAVTPSLQPARRDGSYPASVVAQAGFHMSDLACPLAAHSWESICWSAWTAIHAARQIQSGEDSVYALCRPPGHHASSEVAGGFCYLNNSAIAAQTLRETHARVAILDVDLHHGNGTQDIFYQRDDVLTVSIHADPTRFYPFFLGYANEAGEAAGEGFNLNLPLPRGSSDPVFLSALNIALDRIKAYQPGALVIALGLDAYQGDPFAGLEISTDGFADIGKLIATKLHLPTLIVQEGGYLCDGLADNLVAFLQAYTTDEHCSH